MNFECDIMVPWYGDFARRANAANATARKKGAKGRVTWEQLRDKFVEQRGLCAYCETDIFYDLSVDHIVPFAKTGSNDISNICLCCKSCNSRKSSWDVIEWRRHGWPKRP